MNLSNYHAIDCTEGQEWTEEYKNFWILCAWGRRKKQIEEFIEAVTHVRNAGKETHEKVEAIVSHSICNSHKQEMKRETEETRKKFNS